MPQSAGTKLGLTVLVLGALASPLTAQSAAAPPMYGAWGFDTAGADHATRPGDDFFRFANGGWIDRTTIPADKPSYSLRWVMSDTTEVRLRHLMETAAEHASGHPTDLEGKVGAFYRAFMDQQRLDALGTRPIAPNLGRLR